MPATGHVDDVNPQDYTPPPPVSGGGRGGVPRQAAPVSRTPPPGLLHAAKRAGFETLADLAHLESNIVSIPAKIPGATVFSDIQKFLDDTEAKDRKALQEDAASGGASQTTGEKLTEKVLSTAGGAIPYLAAPEGAIGAGAVGFLQNLDKGPVEAVKGGLKAATFSKAASLLGPEIEGVINKNRVLRAAPPVVKRAVTGATTAAALSPKGEGLSQAIVGGVAGASQRQPTPKNEVRANKLMAATGKTGGDAWSAYKIAGPAMEETATLSGKQPNTPEELKSNVQSTLTRLDNEYKSYLAPISNQQEFGTPIAEAIRKSATVDEIDGVVKESEKIGKQLEKRAKEFDKMFTLGALDGLRRKYFENLKGTSAEALKARAKADVRADRVAEEAIKDLLYPIVDAQAQQAGKPAGYVRGTLKAQQSNLIQLKDALIKRTEALNEQEGARRGTPWAQRSNITLAAHPSGSLVGSQHGLMKKLFGDPDSLKESSKRIGEAFQVKQAIPISRVAATVAASQSKSRAEPKANTVKMRAPNGQESDVPVDQVDHFKSRGAAVVQ